MQKRLLACKGLGQVTQESSLKAGNIPEPRRINDGGVEARVWSDRDLARLVKYKTAHYWHKRH
jgi:hypothetical protein